MVGIASAIIGGVTALGSAVYGAVASSKANERARALIQQQRDENRQWYNARMNEDYTRRSDAQAVINKQRELLDEQIKRARATNIVAGGTDESLALQQQAANEAMAQTMGDIASNASAHKDAIEASYRQQDAALNQQQAAGEAAQAQATAAAASQAVNAGVNMMGAGFKSMEDAKVRKAEGVTAATAGANPTASNPLGLTSEQMANLGNILDNINNKQVAR